MPLIRTDRAALITSAVIVAFFTLEVVRTGLVIAAQTRASLDAWVVMALACGAIYALLFLIGHRALRRRGLATRATYAAIGAVAAVPPFLLAMGGPAIADARANGAVSALLFCPLIAGALMGFLYHRRAGYETAGDDPSALADAGTANPADPAGLLRTADAEYFAGPLVVRTSPGANALAALSGSIVFILVYTADGLADPGYSPMRGYMAANGPALTMLQGMIGCAIPIALLLALAHGVLRAWRRHSYAAYAAGGAIVPGFVSLMAAGMGAGPGAFVSLLGLWGPSLIAMLAYRRLAGLEPAPLPEDIEVSDRRTLVGADHVRRRVARVVDVTR